MAFAAKSGIISDGTRRPRKRAPASSGRHSELHKLVIGEMPPRFCFDSEELYMCDAVQSCLLMEDAKLAEINFRIGYGQMPDIIA